MNSDPDGDFTQFNMISTREITWKIRNFDSLPETEDYALDSPPFDFENATWCLRMYPYYNRTGLGFMIVRLRSSVSRHRLRYNLIWPDEYFLIPSITHEFYKHNEENGLRYFFNRNIPLRFAGALNKIKTLTLMCQIFRFESESSVENAFSQTEQDIKAADVGDLSQNFRNLLLNGQDHDLVLKVKDKEFRAHQNILWARSTVFASMLSHDMIEKNSGAIDIPDCDPGAFEQFLLYLYSGVVEKLDAGNMLALYYVTDKYDVGHLKEQCRQFIKKSLTSTNVSDVIQLALNHSDADLLECATAYFVKHVRAVLPTVEWQSFAKRNSTQANELFIKAADKWEDGTP